MGILMALAGMSSRRTHGALMRVSQWLMYSPWRTAASAEKSLLSSTAAIAVHSVMCLTCRPTMPCSETDSPCFVLAGRPEYAVESNGSGLFTSLLAEALAGGAASLTGEVTVASMYAFVDRNMGAWQQRPQFRASLSGLNVLRECDPLVDISALRLLPMYFQHAEQLVQVVPTAPSSATTDEDERARVAHFRAFRSAGLVRPPAHGALDPNGTVTLTSLGRYYWKLAKEWRI